MVAIMAATMAARAATFFSGSSVTVPLTTRFTPPAECKTHWTYEGSYYNNIPSGILVQNQVTTRGIGVDSECFPSGWTQNGRAYDQQTQVFSPGACPVSYTTVTEVSDGGTTTGVCCYSDFSYTRTGDLAGCVSMYPYDFSTAVTGWAQLVGQSSVNTTVVTGPMTMWAQAMTIQYREADLTQYPALTSSSAASSTSNAAAAGATATSVSATATTAEAKPKATTVSSPSQSPSSKKDSDGLPTNVKAILSVSVSLAGIAVVVLVILGTKMRRRKKEDRKSLESHHSNKKVPLSDGASRTASTKSLDSSIQQLPDHEVYQLPAEPEPSELHGSNWLGRYIPSRISMRLHRGIHQLPADPEPVELSGPEPAELYGSSWQKP
ncbi:hypothetical protein IWX91DRAFT_128311 [Phyllosticta citricarpa]